MRNVTNKNSCLYLEDLGGQFFIVDKGDCAVTSWVVGMSKVH